MGSTGNMSSRLYSYEKEQNVVLQIIKPVYAWRSNFGSETIHFAYRNSIENLKQRTHGPVNAHLISGSSISTIHTKPENDLDLQYSLTFIYLIRCLHLQIFRPLPARVSEKSIVFPFSYRKPKLPNLTVS